MDLPIYRSIYLSIYLSIGLSIIWIYLSTYLPGYSTRLLHFSKLTTSNTQHFCETSSFCEVDHIKQNAILRDLLLFLSWPHQKRNNSCQKRSNSASLLGSCFWFSIPGLRLRRLTPRLLPTIFHMLLVTHHLSHTSLSTTIFLTHTHTH